MPSDRTFFQITKFRLKTKQNRNLLKTANIFRVRTNTTLDLDCRENNDTKQQLV